MGKAKTKVADPMRGIRDDPQTLDRHESPTGNLREDGRKLLKTKRRELTPVESIRITNKWPKRSS